MCNKSTQKVHPSFLLWVRHPWPPSRSDLRFCWRRDRGSLQAPGSCGGVTQKHREVQSQIQVVRIYIYIYIICFITIYIYICIY